MLELVSGLYLTTQTDSKDPLSNISKTEASTVRLVNKDNYSMSHVASDWQILSRLAGDALGRLCVSAHKLLQ